MDPNETLALIARKLDAARTDPQAGIELDEACQDLYDWITRGGFEPSNKAGLAWRYYLTRAVAHRKGERV